MKKRNHSVLYISNDANLGGAGQSLLDMIKVIKKKNVRPIVVIPKKGIIERRLLELDIKYYIVKFSNGYGRVGTCSEKKEDKNFCDNFEAALQIQNIIMQNQIELIHINSSVSNVGAFAALLAGVPYVWHFREFLEEDFDSEFWDKDLKRRLIRRADAIITISNVVAKSYKIKYDINSECIYDGIDIVRYKNVLKKYTNNTRQNRFLITGMITENKGQWDAIKAIKILKEEGIENIHLTIIGAGQERFLWILKRYIYKNNLESYIDILPFQNDLSEYRIQNQYALTTSKMEALGRCTIEAMLAGNIVIGADTGGTKEIIGVDESRGYLYKQGDCKSLAKTMKLAIYEGVEKRELCQKNAQEYAETIFSLEAYADKLSGLYENVLQKYSEDRKCQNSELLNYLNDRYNDLTKRVSKDESNETIDEYDNILAMWKKLTDKKIYLSDYFAKHNYKKIAIYGMGNLGFRVYEEIASRGIEIVYVVDRNPKYIAELFDVKNPNEPLPRVDLLLVAIAKDSRDVIINYRSKCNFPVVGIVDVLKELGKG